METVPSAGKNELIDSARRKYLRTTILNVAAITIIAGVFRLPLLSPHFPLNDGGLHIDAINDIVANSYFLPAYTSYNHSRIPLAYPPLGYFIVILGNLVLGISHIRLLSIFPWIVNVLCVPLFFCLSRGLLGVRASWIATTIYLLLPNSFEWHVMGGGISRGLGQLFLLLLLWSLLRNREDEEQRGIFLPGVLLGLACLSHPSAGLLAALIAVVMIAGDRTPRTEKLRRLFLVASIGFCVSSPWLITVFSWHGIAPFLSASQSGMHSTKILSDLIFFRGLLIEEPDVIGTLGFIGFIAGFCSPSFTPLSIVLLLGTLLDPRGSRCLYASVFLAIFATRTLLVLTDSIDRKMIATSTYLLLIYHLSLGYLLAAGKVKVLSEGSKLVMEELAASGETQKYLVLSSYSKVSDTEIEWFPTLSRQISVTTHQGAEWTGEFSSRLALFMNISAFCDRDNYAGIVDLVRRHRLEFTRIFITRSGCGALIDDLAGDPGLIELNNSGEAHVFEIRNGST